MRYVTFVYIAVLAVALYAGVQIHAVLAAETPAADSIIVTSPSESVRIPILIYHSVHPEYPGQTDEQKAFSVTPEQFRMQLAYLRDNGYTPLSMDAVAAALRTGQSPAPKPVAITFDDGWHNQYDYAFPLLRSFGMTATFYIYTNPLDHESAHFMTWNEVRELRDAGMTIGSHSLTHPYFSTLSPQQLEREVVESKSAIEKQLGIPVRHFASPFGFTNPSLVTELQAAGYDTGRTTWPQATHTDAGRLALGGFFVHPSMTEFAWILRQAQ